MTSSARGLLGRLRAQQSQPAALPTLTHRLTTDNHAAQTLSVRSESDWWVYNEVFVDGDYDEAIRAALESSRDEPRLSVLDLGANAGYFTARMVQRWRQADCLGRLSVHVIEGSPAVHADLEERLRDQGLDDVDVALIHGLVGHREGSAEIAESSFGARNTLYPEHNAGFMAVEDMARHRVPFVDLESLVPDGPIALLKCDVEGSEQLVIEAYASTLLPRVRVAVFEFHHGLVDVEACLALLGEAGLHPFGRVVEAGNTSLQTFKRGV